MATRYNTKIESILNTILEHKEESQFIQDTFIKAGKNWNKYRKFGVYSFLFKKNKTINKLLELQDLLDNQKKD